LVEIFENARHFEKERKCASCKPLFRGVLGASPGVRSEKSRMYRKRLSRNGENRGPGLTDGRAGRCDTVEESLANEPDTRDALKISPAPGEIMQSTIHAIESLSPRIERAYQRHRPSWASPGFDRQVWAVAATRLLEARRGDAMLPVDPELFVAAQPQCGEHGDPWEELTGEIAMRCYRREVRRIVARLRQELRAEIRWSRERFRLGDSIEAVLNASPRILSPLGKYVIAHRVGRGVLAALFRPEAQLQHRLCPLYRHACRGLLPEENYPVFAPNVGLELDGQTESGRPAFSLN
jgi:hypothetical protein